MVPIHDTDIAAERWAQEEWQNYELWEKIEVRLKRQKRVWIFFTALVFVVLSALPITIDRWPKWSSRSILRRVVREVSRVKIEAGVERIALRMHLLGANRLEFQIEKVPNCQYQGAGELVRTGNFELPSQGGQFLLLSQKSGDELGIPGLQEGFCYDPLGGSSAAAQGKDVVGFAVMPSKDFDQKRFDRMSILLLSGASAEVSVD